MRVFNQEGQIITEYDLDEGRLIPIKKVREDAEPIDNIKKFAWAEGDYEDAQMYIPNREKSTAEKIADLKKQLSKTDYKIIKCSECQLLGQELPYDVAGLHAERQAIRDEINKLEQEE